MKTATVEIKIVDLPVFQKLADFAHEYAWHHRECAAIDADGEWHKGNEECSCGFDEAIAELGIET